MLGAFPLRLSSELGRRLTWGLAWLHLSIFLLSAWSGSVHAWGVLSAMDAEIARDLLGRGGSPWDGFDGLVPGPLVIGLLEAPLLWVLGPVGLVHVLSMGLVSSAAVVLNGRLLERLHSPLAGLVAASLIAAPPPTLWYIAHLGAYHSLALVLLPAGLLLLGEPGGGARRLREAVGTALLGLAVATQLGNIAIVGPTLAAWWFLRKRAWGTWDRGFLGVLLIAIGLGLAPMGWKAWFHSPWQGLVPTGAADVDHAVKPLLLGQFDPSLWPSRLGRMMVRDGPYGLHWELGGLPWMGTPWWVVGWIGWIVAVLQAWRRGGALGHILVGPPVAVGVGLVTGWFVFHPGTGEGFSRDGRHLVGLVLGLSWGLGLAAGGIAVPGRHIPWMRTVSSTVGLGAIGVLVVAGGYGLSRSVDRIGLSTMNWQTPFRLSAGYVSGFFRAPFFAVDPERGGKSCLDLPELDSIDCLRGVAFGLGNGAARRVLGGGQIGGATLRACRAVAEGAGRPSWENGLQDACAFGLGWGFSDLAYRNPVRAVEFCRKDPSWGNAALPWCLRGVGWGLAQNFLDRPGALARWIRDVGPKDGPRLAEGVGIFMGMASVDATWIERACAWSVADEDQRACVVWSAWNDRFMGSSDRSILR